MLPNRVFGKITPVAIMSAVILASPLSAFANNTVTAPVSGFARSFLLGNHLANATVTVLETGLKLETDKDGHFGPFEYPVGEPLTLQFEKWGYKTTQSATIIVPPEGLTGPYNNVTFQVPSIETFYLFSYLIGADIDKESCHLTSTITAFHKTMDDVPQGIEDAEVTIDPGVDQRAFYFGIYKSGPLKGKTNPFVRGLKQSSEDGGVAFFNLPPRDEPYVISAKKDGISFTQATFLCRKGAFINISPPRGPSVIKNQSVATN